MAFSTKKIVRYRASEFAEAKAPNWIPSSHSAFFMSIIVDRWREVGLSSPPVAVVKSTKGLRSEQELMHTNK